MFRRKLKNSFYLTIFLISIFSISFGYALLNSTLIIMGTSAIQKNIWDVHFDNLNITEGSVTASSEPSITDSNRISDFTFVLDKRGDFYEFTVDIVNSGSLDAMIDSVEMTPSLTTEQEKYLTYTITYESNEEIKKNQLVKVNDFVRIKVRVEFKSDITAADLPQTQQVLNLGFHINYMQADESGVIVDNKGKLIKVVSGTGTTIGDEVCIGEECFYVISSTNGKTTMLSKYNLLVGYKSDPVNGKVLLDNPTGIQDEIANGWLSEQTVENPSMGTIHFSDINYWSDVVSSYPSYVYNENSLLYEHVENYKKYLMNLGVGEINARLITYDELISLGCNNANFTCENAPKWIYSVSYWTGTAETATSLWRINNTNYFNNMNYIDGNRGVRPVIEVDTEAIRPLVRAVSGNGSTVGDEVCINDECFYTISSDNDSITMLAKYNLYVGSYSPDGNIHINYESETTGRQDSSMKGYIGPDDIRHGVTHFASSEYWAGTINSYPVYIYNENSIIYNYLENYGLYLSGLGANIEEIRLIKLEELEKFGCSLSSGKCNDDPSFIYSTSYFCGTAVSDKYVIRVRSDNKINSFFGTAGVRPVVTIPKNIIKKCFGDGVC